MNELAEARDEPTLAFSLLEAKSLWKMLSHDAYGLSDHALVVRGIMRRIDAFIEECETDAAAVRE